MVDIRDKLLTSLIKFHLHEVLSEINRTVKQKRTEISSCNIESQIVILRTVPRQAAVSFRLGHTILMTRTWKIGGGRVNV